MVALANHVLALGFPALKLRFGRPRLEDDLAGLRAVRDAVGDALELMVDCNQGWRMPWDTRPPWDVDQATEVAMALVAERVYWMEEPLHRGDYAGHVELQRRVDLRIAGGEMTRERYELDELLARGCLDVFQPDCVCTQGITGLRDFATRVSEAGRVFTPHTWGNGIGLLANAHLTAGTVDAPFLEVPFDPPEWTPARRDFLLTEPIEVDGEGWLRLSDRPGLGCTLDEEALARTASTVTTFS
jgi:L-alanine-DL-glutamate epimerase-like enolase superfamily enzyme